jgi:cholesterol transport system auxiliary component
VVSVRAPRDEARQTIQVHGVVNRRHALRLGVLAATLPLLSACAGGLLGGGGSKPTFDLTAPRDIPGGGSQRGLLVVNEPVALAILDSDSVIVRSGGSFSIVPDARWSDRLPKLLQARMVQAYENGNRLKAVGRPGERLAPDFSLVSDVRAFYLDTGLNAGVAELSVKIVNERSGRVVAGRVMRSTVPAKSASGPDVTEALDQALARMLADLVVWTATRI